MPARDEKNNTLPVDAHDLQFKLQALLQLRYVDPRLVFKEVASKRTASIVGKDELSRDVISTFKTICKNTSICKLLKS